MRQSFYSMLQYTNIYEYIVCYSFIIMNFPPIKIRCCFYTKIKNNGKNRFYRNISHFIGIILSSSQIYRTYINLTCETMMFVKSIFFYDIFTYMKIVSLYPTQQSKPTHKSMYVLFLRLLTNIRAVSLLVGLKRESISDLTVFFFSPRIHIREKRSENDNVKVVMKERHTTPM